MSTLNRVFWWLLFFIPLVGCSSPPSPLKIGINVWVGYAHAFIAQDQGFFAQEGVTVELILKENFSDTIDLYKQGQLDGLFGVFTDVIMLNLSGFPTQSVYVADYSDSADVIVGRAEFTKLPDLRGKIVAFEGFNSFSHFLVLSLLANAGLNEGEYQTANLNTLKVLAALEKGQIDAGHTWEPITSQALQKGYKILGKAGDIPGLVVDVLSFRSHLIQTRATEIQAMVNALLTARNFISTYPDQAVAIIAKAEGLSKKEVKLGLQGIRQLDLTENRAAMQQGGLLFKSGQRAINFYLRMGQLLTPPNLTTFINPQLEESPYEVFH